MNTKFPGNPRARWRLNSLPGSPIAQAHVPVTYPPPAPKQGRHNPNVPDILPEDLPRLLERQDTPFVVVDGGYPNSPPNAIGLDIRKKIGQTVFQMTRGFGPGGVVADHNRLQRRRMVIPADPRTTPQLQLRARFGRAVQEWAALTPDERLAYNTAGKHHHPWLEGINLWIRDFCRAHQPADFADDAEYLRTHGVLPPLGE